VLDDVEKKRSKGYQMINMSADEFDKRFDNGDDIIDLMQDSQILTIDDLKKIIKTKESQNSDLSISLNLNTLLLEKLRLKADELSIGIDDLVKVILAERFGLL
jgi:hypothetical protein